MNTWAIVSLVGLAVVVLLANWKNINVGIVGFAMAMFLATIAGLKLKDVYNEFNTQLFLRMLGMQTLIVIARTNGTLQIMASAVMKLTRGKLIRLLPIFLYVIMGIANWFQMGISLILTPLVFALGVEMGFANHLTLGFCTMFGSLSWALSPYSMHGLNLQTYAAQQGYTLNLWAAAFNNLLVGSVVFIAMYFILGWPKMQPVELAHKDSKVTIGYNQIMTLCGFAAFVFCNIALGIDIMVTPVCAAIVLICLGCGDGKIIVKEIPWNSLIMIGGMTVYVGIIKHLGGVDLLTSIIASVANKTLAPALMSLLCSIMSLFSSGNGVVIPTMTATISGLAAAIPGLNIQAMFVAVNTGAVASSMSPMSTVGAQALAYYSAAAKPDDAEFKKAFNRQMLMAIACTVWSAFAGLIGLFGLFK